ncbi:MAG: hypothetical protein QXK37_06590 [Candidatus Woesearchaeota archaeon]
MMEEDSLKNYIEELNQNILNLNDVISDLTSLFKEAKEDLEKDAEKSISEKLDIIISQNEKIAKAVLALAEIIQPEEEETEQERDEYQKEKEDTKYITEQNVRITAPAQITATLQTRKLTQLQDDDLKPLPLYPSRRSFSSSTPSISKTGSQAQTGTERIQSIPLQQQKPTTPPQKSGAIREDMLVDE